MYEKGFEPVWSVVALRPNWERIDVIALAKDVVSC